MHIRYRAVMITAGSVSVCETLRYFVTLSATSLELENRVFMCEIMPFIGLCTIIH